MTYTDLERELEKLRKVVARQGEEIRELRAAEAATASAGKPGDAPASARRLQHFGQATDDPDDLESGATPPESTAQLGLSAGYIGSHNTAVGLSAGEGLSPRSGFPRIGDKAPDNATGGGYHNTAMGVEALTAWRTFHGETPYCFRNTAFGRGALRDLSDGYLNVAVGTDAGRHTNLGHRNTFVGANAGKWVGSVDPISDNIEPPTHPEVNGQYVGAETDWHNAPAGAESPPLEGSRNTLVGRNAGHKGVRISSCVAVGYNAGSGWLMNHGAIAIGRNCLLENRFASRTVAIGTYAMARSITGGGDTVAVGHEALDAVSGVNNVAIGAYAGHALGDGNQNVFIGEQAGAAKTSGNNNVFIGRLAGEQNLNGSGNIFIGRMAGRTDASAANTLIIHNATTKPFLRGSMGDGNAWWLQVRGNLEPSTTATWALGSSSLRWTAVHAVNGVIQPSDRGLKNAIEDDDLGIEFISKLRPVVWKWRNQKDTDDHRGLIAQDVAHALQEFDDRRGFAGLITDGGEMGLCMTEFIGPLIKSVQQLESRISTLESGHAHDADREARTRTRLR
jgi:hypothetical protein